MSKFDNMVVMRLLQEHGAILNGHFQLPSGFHSQIYIQTSLVMQYPHIAHKIGSAMAEKFAGDIDVVLASGQGAVVAGHEVARVKKARAVVLERENGIVFLKKSFELKPGDKVLVVDDVITGGNKISSAVALAQQFGAKVIGVSAIVDRSAETLSLSVPARALLSYPLEIYPPSNCPLCKKGIPLTSVTGI